MINISEDSEEFGMASPHWTVKNVGVWLAPVPPTEGSLTCRLGPWGREELGLEPGKPNLPERVVVLRRCTRGQEATEASPLCPS